MISLSTYPTNAISTTRVDQLKKLSRNFQQPIKDDETSQQVFDLADSLKQHGEPARRSRKSSGLPWKMESIDGEVTLIPGKQGYTLGEGGSKKARIGVNLDKMEPVAIITAEIKDPENNKKCPPKSKQRKELCKEVQIMDILAQLRGNPFKYSAHFYVGSSKTRPKERFQYSMPLGKELISWLEEAEECDLTTTKSKTMLLDMARDVRNLHDNKHLNYAHRDIKLENFLVKGQQRVELIDFGTTDNEEKSLHLYKGTPIYFAPEILINMTTGKKCFTTLEAAKKADIFALGMVFYAMLAMESHSYSSFIDFENTFRRGKPKPSVEEIFKRHQDSQNEARKNFDTIGTTEKQLLKLVEQMMSFSPEDRPSIQEVVDFLKKPPSAPNPNQS